MRVGGPAIMQPTSPMKAPNSRPSLETSPPAIPTATQMLFHPPPTPQPHYLRELPHYRNSPRRHVNPELPLLTAKFGTSWISPQRTSRLAKTSSARHTFQIGKTTPPAPISATLMKCERRIPWVHRYGSSTAKLRLNCPIRSEWKI